MFKYWLTKLGLTFEISVRDVIGSEAGNFSPIADDKVYIRVLVVAVASAVSRLIDVHGPLIVRVLMLVLALIDSPSSTPAVEASTDGAINDRLPNAIRLKSW